MLYLARQRAIVVLMMINAVLFIIERGMLLDILASKPYHSIIQGLVAYLINYNALNDLCGQTLRKLSLCGNMKDILTAAIKIMRFKHL